MCEIDLAKDGQISDLRCRCLMRSNIKLKGIEWWVCIAYKHQVKTDIAICGKIALIFFLILDQTF